MGNKTSISEIIEIECDLFYHAKNVVKTVCNNIAKDVEILLAPTQNNQMFFINYFITHFPISTSFPSTITFHT